MKICIATHSIDKSDGGPSRSVPILAKGLAEIGLEVTLLTLNSQFMNIELLKGSSVKLISLPRNNYRGILKNIIEEERFDIIHSQNLWTPFYHWVSRLARDLKIPYIMTPRGTLEPWSLSQKRIKKQIALKLYQKKDLDEAAAILTTSGMEADHIRQLGIKPSIAIIPNGIDFHEYPCRPISSKNSIKKQILFLSRIHKKKGVEILIEAWKNISYKFPDWKIVVVGNGDNNYISYLKNKINVSGISRNMEIIPPAFNNEKYKLYFESAIFILPSYSENFGMVIAEALSCGLPVITTKDTPWESLDKENIGWWINLSADTVSKTLESAINLGIDTLFDMGQKGSVYVRNNYQYNQVALKNKMLYEWILNSEGRPDFIL